MKPVDLEKAVLQLKITIKLPNWLHKQLCGKSSAKLVSTSCLLNVKKSELILREIIDEKTEAWGIKATAVEVRDVIIPSNLQDAMSRQAQAERERMARVTLATAEFEASQK